MPIVTALRSERLAAVLLVLAAILGLVLANAPTASGLSALLDAHLGLPGTVLDLSVEHWVGDGLLALFFLVAAIELKHELVHGRLDTVRKALVPAVAAVGGVVVPALLFLIIVPGDLARGWPIPTATDIAFALGVLSLVGRGLPASIRVLLLALAVIDDLIAILLIAIVFTTQLQVLPLLLAVVALGLLAVVSRMQRMRPGLRIAALIALGVLTWILVLASGVHATVAGVAVGLALPTGLGERIRVTLEPVTNGVVLPVFAFVAAAVALPALAPGSFGPVFFGILIALPIGKLVGITLGAMLATRLAPRDARLTLPLGDVLVVASLGGIGFTVSLLMKELAYTSQPDLNGQATLAVLLGSTLAAVIGATIGLLRARRARRLSPADLAVPSAR